MTILTILLYGAIAWAVLSGLAIVLEHRGRDDG